MAEIGRPRRVVTVPDRTPVPVPHPAPVPSQPPQPQPLTPA